MKLRLWPDRRWIVPSAFLLAVVLVPYGFSRVASMWRCVSVHSRPDAGTLRTHLPERGLRVACYNIAHGRGVARSNWEGGQPAKRMDRLEKMAELLRQIDADVVVLNEVDFDSSWSHSVNQARYLAEKAGYPHWAEQRNLDFRVLLWKWRFGNAVLSKYPLVNARVADLPGYSLWETILAGKKNGLLCDIQIDDRMVHVCGTHLSHRSELVRVRSATVLARIAVDSSEPVIVAGDLNSTPPGFPDSDIDSDGNNAITILDNSGSFQRFPTEQPLVANELTFPSLQPHSIIDWILIPRGWRFKRYTVVPSQLSDHRPVYADVALPGDPDLESPIPGPGRID